jgi:thiamine-phosphate pyrophosphorylase
MPYPDRFYPVVDTLDWVKRLTALGVGTVQLRAKDLDDASATAMFRDALAVTQGTPTKLVVNDYWRVAIELRAQHLHLGQEDLAEADVAAIKKAGIKLGLSTHDEEELETALRAEPDYVALGPIFFTTLKSMRFAPQGIPKIGVWKKRIGDLPLVAIGGIKLEHAAEIYAAGADSIAVVSDVTQHADPDARVRQWLGLSSQPA